MGKIGLSFGFLALAGVAYAVYFDYQRHHSAEFRHRLKKSKKEMQKLEQKKKKEGIQHIAAVVQKSLTENPLPTTMDTEFFSTELTRGEQLAAVPGKEIDAALHFFRAISVYPNPQSIIKVLQTSVRPDINDYVLQMIAIAPPPSLRNMVNEAVQNANEAD